MASRLEHLNHQHLVTAFEKSSRDAEYQPQLNLLDCELPAHQSHGEPSLEASAYERIPETVGIA
jgi:hypothetical protein